ncbi:hypothetical protein CRENBAI_013316, partial [Crenichthys baileyi]
VPIPHRGNQPPVPGGGQSQTENNHPNTQHHPNCNDSPEGNIIQFSSTITAQPIQIPVTPHPRRGHNTATPHAAVPPPSSTATPIPPPSDTTASRAAHCEARPTIRPAPAAPPSQSMRGKHAPAGFPGRTGQLLQVKHNRPAAPVQAQDMLHRPTHLTAILRWKHLWNSAP